MPGGAAIGIAGIALRPGAIGPPGGAGRDCIGPRPGASGRGGPGGGGPGGPPPGGPNGFGREPGPISAAPNALGAGPPGNGTTVPVRNSDMSRSSGGDVVWTRSSWDGRWRPWRDASGNACGTAWRPASESWRGSWEHSRRPHRRRLKWGRRDQHRRRWRQLRQRLRQPRHAHQRVVAEMARQDHSAQPQEIARKPPHILLRTRDPACRELHFELLRSEGLLRVGFAARDVSQTRGLIDDPQYPLAGVVELDQHAGDLLDRQPLDQILQAALVAGETGPILDRDQLVLAVVADQLLQCRFFAAGIDACDLQRPRQPVDARSQVVELGRLVLVLVIIGNRGPPIIGDCRPQCRRRREEAGQLEGIRFFVEWLGIGRIDPDDLLLLAVPVLPYLGFLEKIAERPLEVALADPSWRIIERDLFADAAKSVNQFFARQI